MDQKRKLRKRIASLLLCMVMVLSIVNLPTFRTTVKAAGTVNAPSKGTFWTYDELLALTGEKANEPYYTDEEKSTLQKGNFAGKTWYVIGVEGNSLVMLSDSQVGISSFDMNTNRYVDSHLYQCLNGDTNLPVNWGLIPYHLNTLFRAQEREYMQVVNLSGVSTLNWLYLPNGKKGSSYFTVGSGDQYSIPIHTWTSNNQTHAVQEFFWLRSPGDYNWTVNVVWSTKYDFISDIGKDASAGSVVPAFHLCID